MAKYIAFVDNGLEARWYGSAQLYCYVNGLEVGQTSESSWWSSKPTLPEVEAFAWEVIKQGFAFVDGESA